MTASELVAAVDVGGTRIKAALVDSLGVERVSRTLPTPTGLDRPGVLVDTVASVVDDLVRSTPGTAVQACGVVVPGIVDDVAGVARWSGNLGWRDLPLAGPLAERTGLRVALGHDVRAGLLAEVGFGAARGARNALFVAIGTGIAGALLVDGRVLSGEGYAGELGHVVVEPGGPRCACGGNGCLEVVASAAAIERAYTAARAGSEQLGESVTAEVVARRVAAAEPAAVAVWGRAVEALATAVTAVVTLTGIDLVVLGGGLAESGDLLLGPLAARVAGSLTFQRRPAFVRAALGDRAGCLGAACLARGLA